MKDYFFGLLAVLGAWVVAWLGKNRSNKRDQEKVKNENKESLDIIDKLDSASELVDGFSDFVQ